MRRTAIVIGTLAVAVSGGVLAAEAAPKKQDAALIMYLAKPGCGPDKTDGVAGNSGRHTGQPPKAPNRQDCPHPPGQNK